MTDTRMQERARAAIAQGTAYASGWMLMTIREMELKEVSGNDVAGFIAVALTEAERRGAEEMRERAIGNLLARQSAEMIMRDNHRMKNNKDKMTMHGDRAQAFREAENAIHALSPDGGDK